MTPEELAAIRERAEKATYYGGTEQDLADDVLALLDEVQRLCVFADAVLAPHRESGRGTCVQCSAPHDEYETLWPCSVVALATEHGITIGDQA